MDRGFKSQVSRPSTRQLVPSAAMPTLPALVTLLFWTASVLSDTNSTTPSGVGCVDPQGLVDCYNNNVAQATSCTADADKNCDSDNRGLCLAGCANYQLAANVGCWLESCWNQVYGCEFQDTVIQYIDGADRVASSVSIPFYPPPDDAPGACSCNLGMVYEYMSEVAITSDPCDPSGGNTDLFNECQCCYFSSPISKIINTCPKSDLSILGVPTLIQQFAADIKKDIPFTDACQSALGPQNVCSSFNLTSGPGAFVDPAALPSGVPGTEPLSTMTGTVTSLPGPQTLTLELFPAYTSTIVMAKFDEAQVTQTAAPTAGAGGGGASDGGSGSGAGTAKGNGGAERRIGGQAGLGVLVWAFMFNFV
ncbi:hypothetical protein FB45DRAFT_1000494 [Roridomyces roridus]|uniref:Uncharacterized protein n=1 Tax=Roridomyces roridus TaxID=1738132 RepID=A0AAD7C947_9AGAR|nr:hypothetical protein FB45DRAFT_1000494 [Roridomyces roridus]